MQTRKLLSHLTDSELKVLLTDLYLVKKLSISDIASRLDVSREFVSRWLANFGIETRNNSEAMIIRHKRMTHEERQALASKAHEARRGSRDRVSSLRKRARGVSNKARMSEAEKTFAKALIDNDIYDFIFSYPEHIFNIDFAFPDQKVAVEVDGGNWHSTPRKTKQDIKKENYLTSEGWIILRWSSASHLVSRLPDVIAQLKTHLSAHS